MKNLNIKDIAVLDLEWKDGKIIILKESDHILRRFGQISIKKFKSEDSYLEMINQSEDEVWTLISGEGVLQIRDLRDRSPSYNKTDRIELSENEIKTVLIPFGLNFGFEAKKDSEIVCIRTEQE